MDSSVDTVDSEYRAYVGPTEYYDVFSAIQFNLLTALGLRDYHYLLDIGCGSLRAGRLFIPYLQPGRYFGIEPVEALVKEGISNELGEQIIDVKRPQFDSNEKFMLSVFDRRFDFLVAQSIFSHTSQDQMRQCFAELRKAMKPTGVLAATFFEGEDNYQGNSWVVKALYSMEFFRGLVEEQGLECTAIDWPHPDTQRWVLIHHKNYTPTLPESLTTEEFVRLHKELEFYQEKLWKLENSKYVKVGRAICDVYRTVRYFIARQLHFK